MHGSNCYLSIPSEREERDDWGLDFSSSNEGGEVVCVGEDVEAD